MGTNEAGNSINILVTPGEPLPTYREYEDAIDEIARDALTSIESQRVFEIRAKIPMDCGRDTGVAWYSCDEIQGLPMVECKPYPGELFDVDGYYLIGRLRKE